MKQLQFWKMQQVDEGTLLLTVPSTNATVTVDATGLMPHGNFRNMNSDEHSELIQALENAIEAHKTIAAVHKAAAAAAQETLKAQATAITDAVAAGTPKKKTADAEAK